MLLAAFRLLTNVLRLPFLPLWLALRALLPPRGDFLHVRLRPRLAELPRLPPRLLRLLPGVARMLPTPLSALRALAVHAGRDRSLRGVLFEIPSLSSGWAACAAVRDVMASLRARGLEVVAFLPEGGGNREVYVASAADRVVVSPQALLTPLGLAVEARYLKPLLTRLGIEVHPIAQGEYKSAAEGLARDSMSDAQREQLGALLGSLDAELAGAVAGLAGMGPERARSLFERAVLRGESARDAGLASALAYEDELPTVLSSKAGEPARLVPAARYLAFARGRFFSRVRRRPFVAVVELHGPIVHRGGGAGRVDADSVAATLRSARRDRHVLGVVLHVDSPGGSAVASDLIHREVVRLAEKKPVVACMADVAASGGYYVAAPAHAIVARATTVTGSIGVITAKVVAEGLLDAIGVRTETLRASPHADMFSPARQLEAAEVELLDREMRGFYEAFVGVVAKGRGKTFEEADALARGRVWSGRDALERGLVDRLGGLEVAVDAVLGRLGVPEARRPRVPTHAYRAHRPWVPPAEPPEAAAAAIAARLAPELEHLVRLTLQGERVFFYDPALPRIL